MKKIILVSFGSDPEFCIVDNNNNPVIICNNIPGSKEKPHPIGEGFGVQPDGVAIEMTVPPVFSTEDFTKVIVEAKERAEKIVTDFNKDYKLSCVSSARYPLAMLEEHPSCMEFGCSPSFSGWTLDATPVPPAFSVGNYRSFGFHVHLGFEGLSEEDDDYVDVVSSLMRLLDIHVALPALLIDKDVDRRRIYGAAADFRNKQLDNGIHLLEYRVLGGGLMEKEETIDWVISSIKNTVDLFNEKADDSSFWEKVSECGDDIQNVIKTGDIEYANQLMSFFNVKKFSNVSKEKAAA